MQKYEPLFMYGILFKLFFNAFFPKKSSVLFFFQQWKAMGMRGLDTCPWEWKDQVYRSATSGSTKSSNKVHRNNIKSKIQLSASDCPPHGKVCSNYSNNEPLQKLKSSFKILQSFVS